MDSLLSPHPFMSTVHHIPSAQNLLGVQWPSAVERPLFYIGIYAAIGLATAVASLTSIIAQYTGALRASRLIFKRLLVAVVSATMRWHDVTPQGQSGTNSQDRTLV